MKVAAAAASTTLLLGGVGAFASAASAATVSWIDPSGGNFSDGGNWSGGVVPAAGDDVTFNLPNPYTTTFDVSPTSASLALGGNGVVTFATNGTPRTYTVSGAASVNSGTLTLDGAVPLQLNAGSLAVQLGGQMNVLTGNDVATSGAIAVGATAGAGTAALVIANTGSTLVQSGAANIQIGTGSTTSLQAALDLSASGALTTGTGTLTVYSSGRLTLGSTATLNANGAIVIDGGTFQRTGGTYTPAAGSTFLATNGGQVLMGSSNFNIRNPWTLNGGADLTSTTFVDVANGVGQIGSLVLDGAGTTAAIGSGSFWGAGGGNASVTVRNGAAFTASGTVSIANGAAAGTSGSVSLQSGGTLSVAGLNVATGGQTGSVTVGDGGFATSALSLTANLIVGHASSGSGTVIVNPSGVVNSTSGMTVNGTGLLHILSGSSASFGGGINVNSAGGAATAAHLLAEGQFVQTGPGAVTIGHATNGQGRVTVRNLFSTGTGTTNINATGTLAVEAGGSYQTGGNINVNGGTLRLSDGGFIVQPATRLISLNNNGKMRVDNGSLTANRVDLTAATARFDTTAGVFSLNASQLNALTGRVEITTGAASGATAVGLHIGTGISFGQLELLNSSSITVNNAVLGDAAGSTGFLSVQGAGSTFTAFGGVSVGGTSASGGVGGLQIQGGAADVETLQIWNNGWVSIGGGGSLTVGSISNAGAFVFSDGTLRLRNVALDVGGPTGGLLGSAVSLLPGQNLIADVYTNIEPGATLAVDGGSLTTAFLTGTGSFAFNAGTLALTGSNLDVGTSGLLGANVTLPSNKTLAIGGQTNIQAGASLTIDGGTFATGSLVRGGIFDFKRGTFKLTNTPLTIGPSGFFGSTLTLNADRNVEIGAPGATIESTGQLYLPGGTFTSLGGITNNGQIRLDSPAAMLDATVTNNKLVTGTGRIGQAILNNAGGEIRVSAGQELLVTGGGSSNAGRINVTDGTIEFAGLFNNTGGQINGRGTFSFGGLQNFGQVQLSAGISDVFGTIANHPLGKVIVTGGATATFYDAVDGLASSEFRVSSGATAVFFGNVTGATGFTGSGTKIFEAGTSAVGAIATVTGTTIVESPAAVTAQHVREAALTVNGEMTIAQNGSSDGTSRVADIDVAGRLDLKDNKLIVVGGDIGTFGGDAYSGITGRVASAYNFSAWDGDGIATTMPDAGAGVGLTGLAIATADEVFYAGGTFGGVPVASGDVLVMYTYAGDVNMDGLIDGADYGTLDNWIQFPGTSGYANGDVNYDGVIDGADYGTLDNSIQLQGAPFPAGTYPAAPLTEVMAVPEPAACGFALLAALLGRRRRRHRSGWM